MLLKSFLILLIDLFEAVVLIMIQAPQLHYITLWGLALIALFESLSETANQTYGYDAKLRTIPFLDHIFGLPFAI